MIDQETIKVYDCYSCPFYRCTTPDANFSVSVEYCVLNPYVDMKRVCKLDSVKNVIITKEK